MILFIIFKSAPKRVVLITVDVQSNMQKFINENTSNLKDLQEVFNDKTKGFSSNYLNFDG